MHLECEDLIFDSDTRRLWSFDQEARLSAKAFDLLAFLISRRPRAVSKADIRHHLWPDTFVSESSLPSLVAEIREAIGDQQRTTGLLRTVHGFGYAFRAEQSAAEPHVETVAPGPNGWLIGSSAEVELFPGENVIGREGVGVVLVKSATVSRRHARIVVHAGRGMVEDLGSRNGTWINDRPVLAATPVADGDQVRIGSLLFTFRLAQASQSTGTSAPRSGPGSRR